MSSSSKLGDYLNGGCRTRVNGVTRCSLSRGGFFLAVSPFTRLLNASLWVMRFAREDLRRSIEGEMNEGADSTVGLDYVNRRDLITVRICGL